MFPVVAGPIGAQHAAPLLEKINVGSDGEITREDVLAVGDVRVEVFDFQTFNAVLFDVELIQNFLYQVGDRRIGIGDRRFELEFYS